MGTAAPRLVPDDAFDFLCVDEAAVLRLPDSAAGISLARGLPTGWSTILTYMTQGLQIGLIPKIHMNFGIIIPKVILIFGIRRFLA